MATTYPLIGKTITAVYLAEDDEAIRFDLSDGTSVVARTDGDCCSHTWIEDVIGAEALIGAPVIRAEDVDLPEELRAATKKPDHYEEEMQYYGFVLDTQNGRCTIAYRNSSNGYYGGSLSWPGEYHYGGVHGQNVSAEKWRQIAPEVATSAGSSPASRPEPKE